MNLQLKIGLTFLFLGSIVTGCGSSPSPQAQIPSQLGQDSLAATVVAGSVHDGDTFRVMLNGRETKIRLCGIDAPELDQPLGAESRDYLERLLSTDGGGVIVVPVEMDQYGRQVAEIFIATGAAEELHVTSEMVMAGMAYHYARYSGTCPNGAVLPRAEAIAQANKVGVWGQPGMVPPWEWRQQQREQANSG